MSSHSSGNELDSSDEKTYHLGLFSPRLKAFVGTHTGLVKAKTEIQLTEYYPRLKGLFPGDAKLPDVVILKKLDAGQATALKEINLSEVEVSELKVVKINTKPSTGKPGAKRVKVDDDYYEETGIEIVRQLPENVEISLEYSTSLELVFIRSGDAIRLHALIINNTEILN